ncbi:MAG: M48 family metalloprotease [Candidatus Freyarchaeota archaeon]|nr:M48 family metalloprotease [Candidatus Jordarchaeia archaeon]
MLLRTLGLKLRMVLVVTFMFALFYALIAAVMYLLNVNDLTYYIAVAVAIMWVQYIIGPGIVDLVIRVRYVEPYENPRLYNIVARVAAKAGIPMPRVGISDISVPNAFAYGRTMRDARVCVTRPLLELLSEDELEAVIGHEIGHIKHRDMIIITALSVMPLICYYIFLFTLFSGYENRGRGAIALLIGIGALVMYWLTELMVLYMSRIREYYADARSVELVGRPEVMASALYKLTRYNVARKERFSEEEIRKLECIKAFLAVKPSYSVPKEILVLMEADVNRDGRIDAYELLQIKEKVKGALGFGSRIAELFSTHPNILKRIAKLADYII